MTAKGAEHSTRPHVNQGPRKPVHRRCGTENGTRMRAVVRNRYGPPDVVAVTELPKPTPKAGELIIAVCAVSLNTADLDFLTGHPAAARVAFGLIRPRQSVMGADLAGTVESVGPGVTQFRTGDEVWADLSGSGYGALAEYACVRERVAADKPEVLSFAQAATVPHSAVLALQGLTAKRPIQPGQSVLINGAGGCVGPYAVQLAKSFGAEVTAVDCAAKLDWLRSIGADHVIDYAHEDVSRNGRRYHYILDIAAQHSVIRYRRSLTADGSYALVARTLTGYALTFMLGGVISAISKRRMGNFLWAPSRRTDLDTLAKLLMLNKIQPLIDSQCELEEVPHALRKLAAGQARGKIVIILK